uniref:NADH-ubiquinone oxidoreductase chain 2 n=1 Tax=Yanocephalus yanonis TaxID=317752 RepID=A0A343KJ44_9HEMI|nr:NADH dehydrogenase subunit 2 [Yanocephalus yanonis]ATG83149.1 NADH dehydrogenase subunit 2 [Yanocephalus yanonis]
MLFNSTKLTLANVMMIGVIMTICSNNWISMWMGLEITLLSFIPFMQSKIKTSSESMMKYFIIQSVASTMFMFSMICMLIGVNMLNEMFLSISMLIKLGSAPFHNWVLMIIENISYMTLFSLLTIIKIPPLMILYQINSKIILLPIIISMIVSSIMCINQSSVKKTLGFSSIYNSSMMLISMNKVGLLMNYMLIYSLTMLPLTVMVSKLKINYMNQMVFNDFSTWMKTNMWINMLSMGGFPPLMGFLGKLMIMQNLISNNQNLLTSILMMTSILVMLFYTRMAFTSMMTIYSLKKWIINKPDLMKFIMSLNLTSTPLILTLKSVL